MIVVVGTKAQSLKHQMETLVLGPTSSGRTGHPFVSSEVIDSPRSQNAKIVEDVIAR